MPNYRIWDLVDEFTVAQASCLWCEVDLGLSFDFKKMQFPGIAAIEQMLVTEIWAGSVKTKLSRSFLAQMRDLSNVKVSRQELIKLAERKGERPKFLFPTARQRSPEVQASENLAPDEGLVPTHAKAEDGKPSADPQGRPKRGPKPGHNKGAVAKAFAEMVQGGEVSFEHGGKREAARQLGRSFTNYALASIEGIIKEAHKEAKEKAQLNVSQIRN